MSTSSTAVSCVWVTGNLFHSRHHRSNTPAEELTAHRSYRRFLFPSYSQWTNRNNSSDEYWGQFQGKSYWHTFMKQSPVLSCRDESEQAGWSTERGHLWAVKQSKLSSVCFYRIKSGGFYRANNCCQGPNETNWVSLCGVSPDNSSSICDEAKPQLSAGRTQFTQRGRVSCERGDKRQRHKAHQRLLLPPRGVTYCQ